MSNYTIYRAAEFGEGTRWNYPLKQVEVVIQDNAFAVYVYDVGFEPPYYDATRLPTFFSAGTGLEGAEAALREQKIFVNRWREVDNLFLHECNAIIRSEIRSDIAAVYPDVGTQRIGQQAAEEAIEALSKFNGHSVLLHVLFLEKVEDEESASPFSLGFNLPTVDKLRSYANYGYVMFRTPSSHGRWGFVCKATQDGVTVLVEADANMTCILYDQASRSNMTKGDVVQMRFDLITDDGCFVVSHDGLTRANQTAT